MEKTGRQRELDWVRVIAMLGVIVIHVTGTFVYAPSGLSLAGMSPGFLLNQWVRFAVPLFMILSGMSLGLGRDRGSCWGFWRARLGKLLPPYLGWTLIYWYLSHGSFSPAGELGKAMLWGTASAHLYFIVVVFQFYLVYPALKGWVERWPAASALGAVAVSLVFQQLVLYASEGLVGARIFSILPFWELLPTWIYYFVLGMVLQGRGLGRLCDWCGRHVWFLAPVTVAFGVWYAYVSRLTGVIDSVKLELFVYAPLMLLTGLGLGRRLGRRERLDRAVAFLARRSQSVFFCHILILELLRRVPLLTNGTRGMLLMLLAEVPLSVALAWGMDKIWDGVRGHFKG